LVLLDLEKTLGVRRYECDASEPAAVELLFQNVVRDLGILTLVVHNIDGRVSGISGFLKKHPEYGSR
jgi:enoyl-[acyl-carrier-protein] reductase (NADH)